MRFVKRFALLIRKFRDGVIYVVCWLDKHAGSIAAVAATRASLLVTHWIVPPTAVLETKYPFIVGFENTGKIPAIEVWSTEEFKFVIDKDPSPNFTECPSSKRSHGTAIIRPGEPFFINEIGPSLTPDQKAQWAENKASIYVHGCVHYSDILHSNGLTEFCGQVWNGVVISCKPNRLK